MSLRESEWTHGDHVNIQVRGSDYVLSSGAWVKVDSGEAGGVAPTWVFVMANPPCKFSFQH